jgi:hypothetical protein
MQSWSQPQLAKHYALSCAENFYHHVAATAPRGQGPRRRT